MNVQCDHFLFYRPKLALFLHLSKSQKFTSSAALQKYKFDLAPEQAYNFKGSKQ